MSNMFRSIILTAGCLTPLAVPVAGTGAAPLGQGTGSGAGTPNQNRVVVVDGSKNPELISDERIVTTLVGHLWVLPPGADAGAERRLRSQASPMKLREPDYEILRRELQQAAPRLAALRKSLSESPDSTSARAVLKGRTTEAWEVYQRVLELMSADGREKLRRHIADSKKNAKITTTVLENVPPKISTDP